MSADTRLMLGIALLVFGGLVMPLGTFFVAATDWTDWVKALVSGVLLFGLEIVLFPAIALMGKENYDRIVNRVKSFFGTLKPAGDVGRTRYTIGLILFLGPMLFAWIASYGSSWFPTGNSARLWFNLGLDLTTVAGLFVLGGDFWDKLRALFCHEARAVFPPSAKFEKGPA